MAAAGGYGTRREGGWAGSVVRLVAAAVSLAWSASCSDTPGTIDPTCTACLPGQGLIVSSPVPEPGATKGASAPARISGASPDVVYASLPSGTVPNGTVALVRRQGDVAAIATLVTDGGFDPVPVTASAGDSVMVDVAMPGGAPVHFAMMVLASTHPAVVRTNPPKSKRDVPLNASIVIVFSEPMRGASVNASSVQLLKGTTPVAGTVSLLPGTTTAAVFEPAASLDPNTDYTLNVTGAAQNLQGLPLVATGAAEFTTGTSVAGPVATVSLGLPDTPATVVSLGSRFQLTATARDGQGIEVPGRPVVWASTSMPILSVSPTGLATALAVGNATITATVDGHRGQAPFQVSSIAVGEVRLSRDSALILPGGSIQLSASIWDPYGLGLSHRLVTWSSTDPSVAAVGSSPTQQNTPVTVTAVAPGVARIVAAVDDKSDTATITVIGSSGRIVFTRSYQLWAVNADGSGLMPLTSNGWSPAWSPDGSRIAFVSDPDGTPDIYTMNADGSGIVRLTNDSASERLPAWSPDGRRIAFGSTRDGPTPQLYVMNADGTGVFRLTYDTATVTDTSGSVLHTYDDWSPTWSPDGSRVAFLSGRDRQIYVIHADGTGMSKLTTYGGGSGGGISSATRLAWSPDGSRFVFNTRTSSTEMRIALEKADGSVIWCCIGVGYDTSPAWSPDGAQIAFASKVVYQRCDIGPVGTCGRPDSIRTSLQVMNANGGGVRTIASSVTRLAVVMYDGPSWTAGAATPGTLRTRLAGRP